MLLSIFPISNSFAEQQLHRKDLQIALSDLAASNDGKVGVCAQGEVGDQVCVNGDQRFSLQSVLKVIVGAATMDAVDRGVLSLDETITLRREDMSVHIQPIEKIVSRDGSFTTTVQDLVLRAVAFSDSAANDVLMAKIGGPAAISEFLLSKKISGIRVDRNERQLQSEIAGLSWQPDFVFPAKLEDAKERITPAARAAAYKAYRNDDRDTATPAGMVNFLHALMTGRLLSERSTKVFIQIMANTATFPNRLRAGVPEEWSVAHKTGTSSSSEGLTAVTNDVGLLTGPGNKRIAVAAFVGDSRGSSEERAAVIANAARAIVAASRN